MLPRIVLIASLCIASSLLAKGDEPLGLNDLDNSDVKWTGSAFGISPRLSDRARGVFSQLRNSDIDKLIERLDDARRFAVAHVMLAEIFRPDLTVKPDSFCELQINFDANGGAIYPGYDGKKLMKYWREIKRDRKPAVDLDPSGAQVEPPSGEKKRTSRAASRGPEPTG